MQYKIKFEAAASPEYEFQKIGPEGLSDVLDLWDKVKSNLAPELKYHLKPLSQRELSLHAMSGYPILGMINKSSNRLAAVLLMTPCASGMNDGYVANSVAEMPSRFRNNDSALIQCVATDPAYARQGLMKKLMAKADQVASGAGLCGLFSKVALDNTASQNVFWGTGYTPVTEIDGDAQKTYMASIFHKKVEAQPLALTQLRVFNGSYGNDNRLPALS